MNDQVIARFVIAIVLGAVAAGLTYLTGQLPLWAAVGLWVTVLVIVVDTWTARPQ